MDKLKFIFDIIKAINNIPARIAFIISFVITLGIGLFFLSGCAYKFHADKIDNVTREFILTR